MRKKERALIFSVPVIFVSLFGCSTTTVHLHANDLPQTVQKNLRVGLEKEGFSVVIRDNASPSEGNAVLYYPHAGIKKDLNAIDNVLKANGLMAEPSIAVQTNNLGTHEYSAGNIGLYFAPAAHQKPQQATSRVRSVFPITVTDAEFVSTDCPTEYGFQFYEDGTLVLNDFSLAIDETEIAAPNWSTTGDTILVSNGQERFEYRKIESHSEGFNEYNVYVVTYNIWLQPTDYYRVPFGCSYRSIYAEGF